MVSNQTFGFEEARRLYEEGRARMVSGDTDSAIDMLEKSVEAYPHFKTLELLGECLINSGRSGEAIVPLAAATTLNNGVRAPSLLAKALADVGDFERSKDIADLALSRDPNNKLARSIAGES